MGGVSNPKSTGGGGRSNEGKDKDDKDDKQSSPGPIGGADSYGMDKDSFDKSIGGKGDSGKDDSGFLSGVSDFFHEKVEAVEHWFKGEEDTGGFSPMGGPSSYGMSKKAFDTTIGERRHKARSLNQRLVREVDYFREAPMDYTADLLKNPMIAGAAAMSGLGMTAFGLVAADAAMDMAQNEATPMESLTSTLSGALRFTTIGAGLGPMKSVAMAALESPEKAAVATGGVMGTQVGGRVSAALASSLTDNPIARAGLVAAGTMGGAIAGKKAISAGIASTGTSGMQAPTSEPSERKDRPTSPLVASGEAAVEASRQLAKTSQQPVDLYARTVEQLPFYGLNIQQQQSNLPYYGV